MLVSKIDAAKRQLDTAIRLWVAVADPVSIHTLACAAYQVVHDLNRAAKGPPLLLDYPGVRPEMRAEFVAALKRDANFFKHADARGKKPRDLDPIEFEPAINDIYMAVTIHGLIHLKQELSHEQVAFDFWQRVQHPDRYRREWQDLVKTSDGIKFIAALPTDRQEFFQLMLKTQLAGHRLF